MQLALTPEVLVPVGAGALLLVIALVVVLLLVRRRRRARAAARATVADAVRPDRDPSPDAVPQAGTDGADDRPGSDPTDRVGSGRTVAAAVAQALAVREARARVAAADSASEVPVPRPATNGAARPAEATEGRTIWSAPAPEAPGPEEDPASRATASRASAFPTSAPQDPAPQAGAPETAAHQIAAHEIAAPGAAAARATAAAGTPGRETPAHGDASTPEVPASDVAALGPARPSGRADARDRLLAVLLDDPVRAVGATVELDACRRQLARLTDAVRHERETLRSVLARLAAAGLEPDQLARLSGLSGEDLQDLLPSRVGVG